MNKKLKLNQVVAIANGEKSRKEKITKQYQALDKSQLFDGFSRTYLPKTEDGETVPEEKKVVQMTVKGAIKDSIQILESMFNIVATQDKGNCLAKADVVVDGVTLLRDVPSTHLIFIEKQLIDLSTFVQAFPTLDPAEVWTFNENGMFYISEVRETTRTKKVPKNHVKAEATDKHPAQVDVYMEEVPIGTWRTIKYSGNISKKDKDIMLEKIRRLSNAVKIAREEANSVEVEVSDTGTQILKYIFEK